MVVTITKSLYGPGHLTFIKSNFQGLFVCIYSLELFMWNFGGIFHNFGSFVLYPEGQMFHTWKFHAKVLYSSTSETASLGTPGSCGGHPVTTKDASCINLSIAKEHFKGKLTVVPIKNPNQESR